MRSESSQASIEALKNMLPEVDLILSTTASLPENRTARCRELLAAGLPLADDLIRSITGRRTPLPTLGSGRNGGGPIHRTPRP